jgi:hypothetical protein
MHRVSSAIVLAACGAMMCFATGAFAQMDAGYLADVRDLKTSVFYADSENLTDVSLALVPPQPNGGPGVSLVLRARFRGRRVDPGKLAEIGLRVHYVLRSDDRVRAVRARNDTHQLSLHIDPQDRSGITLDYFPGTFGYSGFTAPGDEIPVAFFTVTPEELRAMATATTISGEALWTKFTLTSDEIDALKSFRARVLPADRPINLRPN